MAGGQDNNVTEGEEIALELSDEGNMQAINLEKRTLIGRIIADKVLNKNAVKEIVSKAWNLQEELKIVDMGPNIYLFTISAVSSVKKILEGGPWFIMGHLLSLQNWVPEASVFEINYDFVKFWVQLHGMPLEFMNIKNARKIAEKIGAVQSIEDPFVEGQLLRPFFRVKVEVNVKKPLLTGFCVPRKDLPKTLIFVKYERLQDFCYNSGVMGHDFRKCKEEKAMAVHIPNGPRYGPGLAVPQAKTMAMIVADNVNRARRLQGEGGAGKATDVEHTENAKGQGSSAPTIGTESDLQRVARACQNKEILVTNARGGK
ncbi:Zinc knuckle CX2CX4HX4C [Sesbania bispinosa]|nr:Zinc knuckle CX2CX4HX4C [Sesbania bispinosa]